MITDQQDTSLLMISHDLGVIAEMTDRMLVMHGSTAGVFGQMAHPYTRVLFDALPQTGTRTGGQLRTIPGKLEKPGPGFKISCPFAPRCRAGLPPPVTIASGHEAMCFHPEIA